MDTQTNDNFNDCMNECFMNYTVEKTRNIISRCNDTNLFPIGLITCLKLVEHDVRKGQDGYTGKKIQASPIVMFPYEIECFAKCLRGNEYGDEVKKINQKIRKMTESDD